MKKALIFFVVALIFASGLLAGKYFNIKSSPAESKKTPVVAMKPVIKTGPVVIASKKQIPIQSQQVQEIAPTGSIRIRGKL
ncbi:MAG: hypothetical protein WC848_04835 [Parcubacteria group bacterium]|jgi:hypothetical protein